MEMLNELKDDANKIYFDGKPMKKSKQIPLEKGDPVRIIVKIDFIG